MAPQVGLAIGPPVATTNFACTGSEQFWDVPVGVTSVDVVAIGARGGTGSSSGKVGGAGAVRSGTVPVVPGQRLWIEVGCDGVSPGAGAPGAGGFNGGGSAILSTYSTGGGGGGASDVRTVARLDAGSLASRVIVAAGGGGSGGYSKGGAGGAAGAAGGTGDVAGGGGAGTLTAGGLPNGVVGVGGAGLAFYDGGGGGGGGYYGGGGGGGSGRLPNAGGGGGGGGGGSSFFAPQVAAQGTAGGVPGDAPRVSLTYRAVSLSAPSASFGAQPQATLSAPQTVTLTNVGVAPLSITGLVFEGAHPEDFLLSWTDCAGSVAVGASCRLIFRFAPSAAGARTAALSVKTSIGERTIDLSGSGGELPQGPKGDAGAAGAPGLPGPAGKDGQRVLVAYQATASASRATVRYALTGAANITLKVKPPKGATSTVAKAKGKAGINQISWNRKIKGKKAAKGTYKLTITATAGGKTVSSTLSVKLK